MSGNRILWVSEKPVDYIAIERQFPIFSKKFEAYSAQPGVTTLRGEGVFRMPVKAGTIRTCAAACSDEHQKAEDYELHIKDIRKTASDLDCSAVVLDHESAPWPLVSWLAKNDMITSCSDDDNYGYDDPKYIPVFVHWHGNIYFVANLELVEE